MADRPQNIPEGLREEARRAGEAAFELPGQVGVGRDIIPRLPGLAANYSYTVTIDTGLVDNEGREIYRSVVISTGRQLSPAQLRDRGIDALLKIVSGRHGGWYDEGKLNLVMEDMSLADIDAIYRK